MKSGKYSFLLGLILIASGCGPKTSTVSGTVKFNGQSVPEGVIAFIPEEGPKGRGGRGQISEGRYSVLVQHGKMIVEINANKMTPLPPGTTGMYGKTEEPRQYIPDKYNVKSELKENITGPATVDFNLQPHLPAPD